ncbi:SDR family oxidoreductase [Vibrio sonorensis]|uniref:SDR family oxidoreductase n=1 Tax=Vibrio sonorensis TaxID=1004316 RepID=UPI0008D9B760|nr:SDR family oxidoreductase [Vibrio sonorensis]
MKHVLVTGANRGVGFALCEYYLQKGWRVSATYRHASQSQELLSKAESEPHLSCHQLDVTDYLSVQSLAQTFDSLDLLINNAGYYGPKGYKFGSTDVEEWRKAIEVNTIAPLKIAEAFYPSLSKGQDKIIACLSSKVGSMTENTSGGGYIYRSSKAGLNSVVKSLSNDLSPQGFIAVALHPGWVQTEMGGPNALIDTNTSAAGLASVISGLKLEDSGKFIDFKGNALPW